MKTSINILLNQLEDEILRLERNNAAFQRQNEALRAQASDVTLQNDLSSALAKIERLEEAYKDAQSDFNEMQTNRDHLQREYAALAEKYNRMQSQEAFRMALLESVVSAARAVSDEPDPEKRDWFALENAFISLDAWQPDASTDASAPDDGDDESVPECPVCGWTYGGHDEFCSIKDKAETVKP
jgi:DNA repair exonuclease SbcCD ATPase subunit